MADGGPVDDATAPEPVAGQRSEAEKDFLIRQSMVGELEEFFPPEFLDRVKDRFQARLAERAEASAAAAGTEGADDRPQDE